MVMPWRLVAGRLIRIASGWARSSHEHALCQAREEAVQASRTALQRAELHDYLARSHEGATPPRARVR